MNNARDTFVELRGHFDSSDPFMTKGHQIIKTRRIQKEIPSWVKDNKKIQQMLLRSFPKLKTNSKQAAQAGRWVRIIQLYFKSDMTYGQVAAELGMTPRRVESFIRAIYRTSRGLRTDGRGKLGARPIGRPRKSML